jgi:3-phosphoshikimate 1-carboxyvinyltransferase
MRYQLEWNQMELIGKVKLPASKSISNRLLILNKLSKKPGKLSNLSESDDTRVLMNFLETEENNINIGHAGTAMRFLTAFLSIQEGSHHLTGSDRMLKRPIKELVDALIRMGASISYLGEEGYPPLSIHGRSLEGGDIDIDSSISSQYISALMMIGPVLRNGLMINLENEMVSSSYINLTREIMLELGIPVEYSGKTIQIPYHEFDGKDITIEADWSAASYWFAMAAMADRVELEINGLTKQSCQGDAILPNLFAGLGVTTEYIPHGIMLKRAKRKIHELRYDFRNNPDLVQTMVVVCGMLDLPFQFSGTQTLKIKETDRIIALQQEMARLGIILEVDPEGTWIRWKGKKRAKRGPSPAIKTYQDHRMAMAFAPVAMKVPGLIIEEPEVVHKSYPRFWEDLLELGFAIREI